jgi:hypothetical protein
LPESVPAFSAVLNPHSPQRVFYAPRGSQLQFSVPLKSSPREPPDFPSLPARLSLLVIGLRIIVPASLRFTRLDCSVNPLEPKPSCLGTRFPSNKKFDWRALFLNNFLVRFHSLSGEAPWNVSGKDADKSGKNRNP